MADVFGERRRRLLRHLLRNTSGATIEELSRAIGVTRTAVRQHLAALMRDNLVSRGHMRPTGGRPEQLFALTEEGKDALPRRYSWFAQLLMEAMTREHGSAGARVRLGRIAAAVVEQLPQRVRGKERSRRNVEEASALMDELGYNARMTRDAVGAPAIEADNCVFHTLAMKSPDICHFDVALLSALTGAEVNLHECMARGGHVCRFRFTPRG